VHGDADDGERRGFERVVLPDRAADRYFGANGSCACCVSGQVKDPGGSLPVVCRCSYEWEQKWLNVMLSEAKHLAALASRFLAALGMTTFNISGSR
jgi:hypothetical protein